MKTVKSIDLKMKSVCSHSDHLSSMCTKSNVKLEEAQIGKMDKRLSQDFMSNKPKIRFGNKQFKEQQTSDKDNEKRPGSVKSPTKNYIEF